MTRAEDAVPEAGLLAVVVALLPALAVMEVVVLDDELGIKESQQPAHGRWRCCVHAEAAVPRKLGKHHELMTDPPLVEAHRETHQLEAEVGQERDSGNVENLLLRIGVERQQWIGVLGKVVRAVVLPEAADVVHEAMVPVEPEIEQNTIETDF